MVLFAHSGHLDSQTGATGGHLIDKFHVSQLASDIHVQSIGHREHAVKFNLKPVVFFDTVGSPSAHPSGNCHHVPIQNLHHFRRSFAAALSDGRQQGMMHLVQATVVPSRSPLTGRCGRAEWKKHSSQQVFAHQSMLTTNFS